MIGACIGPHLPCMCAWICACACACASGGYMHVHVHANAWSCVHGCIHVKLIAYMYAMSVHMYICMYIYMIYHTVYIGIYVHCNYIFIYLNLLINSIYPLYIISDQNICIYTYRCIAAHACIHVSIYYCDGFVNYMHVSCIFMYSREIHSVFLCSYCSKLFWY